jgi:septum formation protein
MAIISNKLILASQSRYRRELLARLTPDFEAQAANIDESRQPGEKPANLAARLACDKAKAVARLHPEAVIIGSDQVAALDDEVLGKPGSEKNAASQLMACSGREVRFYTAVAVIFPPGEVRAEYTDISTVKFRQLSRAEIDAYLKLDQPWDCAGSFKSEAHGSLLFESLRNEDPTGIIGLPLIWLANCLRKAGVNLLDQS